MSGARRELLLAAFGGALGGVAVGEAECLAILYGTGVVVATPVADSLGVALRYAVFAALLAVASALLLWLWRARRRSDGRGLGHGFILGRALTSLGTVPLAIGAATAGVAFIVAGDWVHERVLANVGFFALRSLLATGGLAIGAALLGLLVAIGGTRARRTTGLITTIILSAALGVIALSRASWGSSTGSVDSNAMTTTASKTRAGVEATPVAEPSSRPRPNIIILVIDTLRADRLSCYGYARPTTPEIDALARRGVLFERACAQAPMTRGSVASLMTSLYPDAHGTNDVMDRLPESATTLAETLHDHGWHTACFSTNENVSPVFGFDQGFDTFWLHRLSRIERFTAYGRLSHYITETLGFGRVSADLDGSDACSVTDAVLSWLPERRRAAAPAAAPLFLYVQYIDPHSPYAPPEDLLNHPSPDPERMATHGHFPHNCPPHPFGRWPEQEPGIAEGISQLYDAEIRYCDREIGRLVRELETRGLLDQSWLLITADHGEEFFDHEQLGHGQSMYEELLHVPLIVLGPGLVPGRVAAPVQIVDLYPTLLAVAGIESDAELHGRDLAELLADPGGTGAGTGTGTSGTAPNRVLFSQRVSDPPLAMVSIGTEKLVLIEHAGQSKALLFDLAADPHEQHDLAAARPDRVEALTKLLIQRRAAARAARLPGSSRAAVGQESLDILRKLGYLGD